MPNRFQGQYGDYVSRVKQMAANTRNPARDRQNEAKRKENQFWGGLASVGLPILGGAAGGLVGGLATGGAGIIPGITAGASLGNTAGQAAGQYFNNQGEEAMDETRKREMERMALLQAIAGFR